MTEMLVKIPQEDRETRGRHNGRGEGAEQSQRGWKKRMKISRG